jgi:hypothetical protein
MRFAIARLPFTAGPAGVVQFIFVRCCLADTIRTQVNISARVRSFAHNATIEARAQLRLFNHRFRMTALFFARGLSFAHRVWYPVLARCLYLRLLLPCVPFVLGISCLHSRRLPVSVPGSSLAFLPVHSTNVVVATIPLAGPSAPRIVVSGGTVTVPFAFGLTVGPVRSSFAAYCASNHPIPTRSSLSFSALFLPCCAQGNPPLPFLWPDTTYRVELAAGAFESGAFPLCDALLMT